MRRLRTLDRILIRIINLRLFLGDATCSVSTRFYKALTFRRNLPDSNMKDLKFLIRPNIQAMSDEENAVTARVAAKSAVWLDMNESPFNAPHNRYPDGKCSALREALSTQRGLRPECIFPAGGNEELVDLLIRLFCIPQKDNVIVLEPSCSIYERRAAVNDIECRRVRLHADFSLPVSDVLKVVNANTKLIFISNPNSPTGNLFKRDDLLRLADAFDGMLVVDEAYVDFARCESLRLEIPKHHNMIVLESFSASWACAALRVGVAYAIPAVIAYLERVAGTWRMSRPVQEMATEMLRRRFDVDKWVNNLLDERSRVMAAFRLLPFCEGVYPSDANFFLVRVKEPARLHAYLAENDIHVLNVEHLPLCEKCLRISVGTSHENMALLGALRRFS